MQKERSIHTHTLRAGLVREAEGAPSDRLAATLSLSDVTTATTGSVCVLFALCCWMQTSERVERREEAALVGNGTAAAAEALRRDDVASIAADWDSVKGSEGVTPGSHMIRHSPTQVHDTDRPSGTIATVMNTDRLTNGVSGCSGGSGDGVGQCGVHGGGCPHAAPTGRCL